MFDEDADRNTNTNNPLEERRRRLMFLRMGLLMCLAIVMLERPRTNSRDGVQVTRPPTVQQEHEDVEFSPRVTGSINSLLRETNSAGMSGGRMHNVTGVFKGLSNGDRTLMQLKSIPVLNAPAVQYVYGIAKIFSLAGNANGAFFPLQGLLVSTSEHEGYLTLLATPLFNRKLALEVVTSRQNATDVSTRNTSIATTHRNTSIATTHRNTLESTPLQPQSAQNLTDAFPVLGAAGLRLVRYASLDDLASSGQSLDRLPLSSQVSYQLLSSELVPPALRGLLYPTSTSDTPSPHCDYLLTLRLGFNNPALSSGSHDILPSQMSGGIGSPRCQSFNVSMTPTLLTAELLDRKINAYVTVAILACLAQIACFVSQLRYSASAGTLGKLSILGLCAQALLESLLCVAHMMLCAAFTKYVVPFFAIASMQLVLFSVFGIPSVVGVYQARYAQELASEGAVGLRRRVAMLHARFYLCLLAVVVMLYTFSSLFSICVVLLYSVWVPQVFWNAYAGTRCGLSYMYLLGGGAVRLLLPLYVLGCPYNMFHLVLDGTTLYSPLTCVALVAWTAAQIAVLLLQDYLGPRFFVPKALLPMRYDYYRPLPTTESGDVEQGALPECVICYCAVDGAADHMVTPCEHLFHRQCLSRWMEVKLECPVCRSSLPSIE